MTGENRSIFLRTIANWRHRHQPRRSPTAGAYATLALTLLLSACVSIEPVSERPPNIVLIVADDQGYGDLGAYGGTIPTPHIDAIARAGVRFTDGYVAAPACVPSRCALLTGRYHQRFGCGNGAITPQLPADQLTLAERLQARGYTNGIIGKWHQGMTPEQHPLAQGFDEFFGFLRGIHLYLPEGRDTGAAYYGMALKYKGELYRNHQVIEETDYLTTAFGREASEFIERHADEPFFLYLAFSAVHVPMQATQRYLEKFRDIENPGRRRLAAMTAAMDDAVGDVMAALRRHDLQEQTLIVYLSDNGGHPLANSADNGPLRGGKGQLYEGGIRVPFLMQWPGTIAPGQVYREPVISLDVAAMALAATGVSAYANPELDGIDLLPRLREQSAKSGNARPRSLYWRYKDQRALRRGDWKMIRPGADAKVELYNLAEDIDESRDLSQSNPGKLQQLQDAFRDMDESIRGYHQVLPVNTAH